MTAHEKTVVFLAIRRRQENILTQIYRWQIGEIGWQDVQITLDEALEREHQYWQTREEITQVTA